jgi:hypothetical protein
MAITSIVIELAMMRRLFNRLTFRWRADLLFASARSPLGQSSLCGSKFSSGVPSPRQNPA